MEEKPEDFLLVTLDVKSLDTKIPNKDRVKAVKKTYDKRPNKTVLTKVIKKLLILLFVIKKSDLKFE